LPTEFCTCVDICEIDSLYADEYLCDICDEILECEEGFYFDDEACMCFMSAQCKVLCPEGQDLLPTEFCTCVDICEIDSLYADEYLCPTSKICDDVVLECGDDYYFDEKACMCFS
jgi:hypothetical protein